MTSSPTIAPSLSTRALGIAGILGGAWLVAWLLPFIPWGSDGSNVRILVYNVGAAAVAYATYRRPMSGSSRFARAAVLAALVANAAYLVMSVLAIGRPQFPQPDPAFRLVGFWVGAAMWWADAALGVVVLRSGGLARWGGLALAVGSVLAFLGMDRLELVSGPFQAVVVPLALAGITLNGIGWILLGLDLATRRQAAAID
jgi:hypothetical protein